MSSSSVDRMGFWASTACAVHCMVCAWLPNLVAALGLAALASHEVEWGLTLLAMGVATGAAVLGWRRHRSPAVMLIFGAGLLGLAAARFLEARGEHVGAAVAVAAGVALALAHLANSYAGRQAHAGARSGSR